MFDISLSTLSKGLGSACYFIITLCITKFEHLPILFVVRFEVVHVTALREVHGVLPFSLFRLLVVDQISGVLNDEFTLGKIPGCENSASLWIKSS